MRKRIKRLVAWELAAMLIVASAFSGCARGDNQNVTTDKTTVEVTDTVGEDAKITASDSLVVGEDAKTTASDNSTSGGNDTKDTSSRVAPETTDFVSDELYAVADQWPSCDDRALAAVMKKAESGEHVVIAVIGGSITQGTIKGGTKDSLVSRQRCYADIFFDWWKQAFPNGDFEFINAGIGGTDSYLGVHRVDEDVLKYKPDLVLVEFSVNDADSQFNKKTYDNLVRKIIKSETSPAVMLLYMGQTNGASAQASHVFIGFNYELPMLSYASLINKMMEDGTYTAKDLSGDEVHPSALGHAITGEIIGKYLGQIYENLDSYEAPVAFNKSAVTKEAYMNATIYDAANFTPDSLGTFVAGKSTEQFPDGWVCAEGDGEISFTATFRNFGALYLATIDGKSGQFDIYIDGECVGTINADFTGGWGNAITAKEYYNSKEATEHTVLIRKSPNSTGDVLKLLGLLIS